MNETTEYPVMEVTTEPELHKKPLLAWLAKSIFVDTIVEFFRNVIHFFAVHINLLLDSFRFVWKPFYKGTREEAELLMNRSQAAFGFLLTVLGFLIFLVKIGAIDEPDANLTNYYGDEKMGIMLNIVFFIILAISYYLLQALLVLLGRAYRFIAKPVTSIAANDLLFINMGNQAFIIGALCGLFVRLIHTNSTIDENNNSSFFWIIGFVLYACIYLVLFSRLMWNNQNVSRNKKIIYAIVVSIFHSLFSSLISTMLVFFYVGV